MFLKCFTEIEHIHADNSQISIFSPDSSPE